MNRPSSPFKITFCWSKPKWTCVLCPWCVCVCVWDGAYHFHGLSLLTCGSSKLARSQMQKLKAIRIQEAFFKKEKIIAFHCRLKKESVARGWVTRLDGTKILFTSYANDKKMYTLPVSLLGHDFKLLKAFVCPQWNIMTQDTVTNLMFELTDCFFLLLYSAKNLEILQSCAAEADGQILNKVHFFLICLSENAFLMSVYSDNAWFVKNVPNFCFGDYGPGQTKLTILQECPSPLTRGR